MEGLHKQRLSSLSVFVLVDVSDSESGLKSKLSLLWYPEVIR